MLDYSQFKNWAISNIIYHIDFFFFLMNDILVKGIGNSCANASPMTPTFHNYRRKYH